MPNLQSCRDCSETIEPVSNRLFAMRPPSSWSCAAPPRPRLCSSGCRRCWRLCWRGRRARPRCGPQRPPPQAASSRGCPPRETSLPSDRLYLRAILDGAPATAAAACSKAERAPSSRMQVITAPTLYQLLELERHGHDMYNMRDSLVSLSFATALCDK